MSRAPMQHHHRSTGVIIGSLVIVRGELDTEHTVPTTEYCTYSDCTRCALLPRIIMRTVLRKLSTRVHIVSVRFCPTCCALRRIQAQCYEHVGTNARGLYSNLQPNHATPQKHESPECSIASWLEPTGGGTSCCATTVPCHGGPKALL